MKSYTQTVNEGEDMGPIDWARPMIAQMEGDKWRAEVVARLREAESAPERFEATTDGGWPRVGWRQVLAVRMYDGWPYWRPTPSVYSCGPLGGEWHSFNSLSEIRPLPPAPSSTETPR